jgi:hypothetical protein
LGFGLWALPALALADLPLTVEDLITDKGKVKLDLSFVYNNTQSTGVVADGLISIPIDETSFVNVPSIVGGRDVNSDAVVIPLGVRYGLSAKSELYGRVSWLSSAQRVTDDAGSAQTSGDKRFLDAWLGLNYQFKEDNDSPALLGFAELALKENQQHESQSFKSASVGLTTYHAIDPIVFSLTVAYRRNLERDDGELRLQPGDSVSFSPSVGFAANDRVTLTTGLRWMSRQADRVNQTRQGLRNTDTRLELGVGYGFSRNSTLTTTFTSSNTAGRQGAGLRINWLYTFGKP